MGFSIFNILHEDDISDTLADQQKDLNKQINNVDKPEKNQNNDNTGGGDDLNNDLDELDGNGGGDNGEADLSELDNNSTQSTDKPIEANTDIFSSLSAEEQRVKISELKKQYNQLYSYCSEIMDKVGNINMSEDNYKEVNNAIELVYSLRLYILEYFTNVFDKKSFIENDIVFNRCLEILNSVSLILNKEIKKIENEDKK